MSANAEIDQSKKKDKSELEIFEESQFYNITRDTGRSSVQQCSSKYDNTPEIDSETSPRLKFKNREKLHQKSV